MTAMDATRWSQGPEVAGVVLGLAACIESIVRSVESGAAAPFGFVLCLLALATAIPLAVLRPSSALVVGTAAVLLSMAVFHSLTVAGLLAQVVLLYRAGRHGGQALALCLAVPLLVLGLVAPGDELLAALAPAAALAGIALRARREASMHNAAREAVAGRLVAHTARGERARIARELHDVVAHHISMIAVQAETARLATPGMPQEGARRLAEIGDTARAGMTEMRRLLGVLREDVEPDPTADRHPQPGLQQLNELIDEARGAAGAPMRLIVSGPPATLGLGVELAVYRIVQEALTNARRHAPGAAVDVELRYRADSLRVRVRDNGPGPSGVEPGGHGLAGMRERAAAVGGRLTVRPAAVGGFVVDAVLPTGVTA
jgi:signal transduction histidine kinase